MTGLPKFCPKSCADDWDYPRKAARLILSLFLITYPAALSRYPQQEKKRSGISTRLFTITSLHQKHQVNFGVMIPWINLEFCTDILYLPTALPPKNSPSASNNTTPNDSIYTFHTCQP
ncbi:uncharacterized protein B0T23DRAFT_6626 [Neurospora hispaniola]|uniref:Uncharacterized protein n=1 Tax=Neurospora hispaniola TaxID=588809 RepID=A0AAJ0IFS3_9PEZI|nr:hypothetical protein B0T23DRAFT_6626 [Neurospora hispaniola]